ncbi:MAG: hypothetical protein OEX12_10680 [Gammaproteobacteria bacterium]|nr:hypothetical protein [Gammaproteobacteria bacterium]
MKKNLYVIVSIIIAFSYWCIEAIVHFYIFNEKVFEIIPDDVNELWMRSIITLLLISFGLFADHHTRKLREKEGDKLKLFLVTVGASNHILNNYLQQMLLFKLEAMKCEGFSSEILELFDQIMDDTTAEIRKLESLTELNEGAIRKAVYPK